MVFIKNFAAWFGLKERMNTQKHRPPLVSERDIWWVSFGANVGSEIDDKSDRFSRPAIVFKKLSHGFYFVIPTTTKEKQGSWFVPFTHKGRAMVACLHQARAIDYRRLSNKLGQLDTHDYGVVRDRFSDLYIPADINIPHSEEQGRG